jgi:hypothetical protein
MRCVYCRHIIWPWQRKGRTTISERQWIRYHTECWLTRVIGR